MPSPLFAKFKQKENRVTASILAVFERISFALVERILQILCKEQNIPLLEIRNQIKIHGAGGVPDGAVQASFAYWVETKIVQNAIQLDFQLPDGQLVNRQLKAHLDSLESLQNTSKKRLLVLTPDYEEPEAVKQLNSKLVSWASFNDLYSAIVEITTTDESWLTSDSSPPSEQERFLLRELVQMFQVEGLLNNGGRSDAVLIVPASSAIEDYQNFSVYLCQANRSFQVVEYIGFYYNGMIGRHIAKVIGKPVEEVVLDEVGVEDVDIELTPETRQSLRQLVTQLKEKNAQQYGGIRKVFFLSSFDSPDTIELAQDIRNTQKDRSGRPTAFTQRQRYVPLSALRKNPVTTTELLKEQSA